MRLVEMLLLLSLMMIILMAANVSTDTTFHLHSYCPTSCGNISIEYPFGIGDGCFRAGFNLTCSNSFNPPKLFLGDNTTEVLSINDLSSFVTISSPVRIMIVEMDSFTTSWKLPVIGPATFLWQNYASLLVIGCSVTAYVFDPVSNYTAGACSSICPGNFTSQASDEVACDGIGCCNVVIPSNFTTFQVLLTRLNMPDPYLANDSAVKVFFTNYFNNYTNKELAQLDESSSVEASLAWLITDQPSCAAAQVSSNYACLGSELPGCYDASDSIIQLPGYFCTCPGVYNGHPYVPNGCRSPCYPCSGICYFTGSGYNCTCPYGTYGDPKTGPCIPIEKRGLLLGIIIGTSLGSGMLFLVLSSLFIGKRWKEQKQKKMRDRIFQKNLRLLQKQLVSSNQNNADKTKIFSLEELKKATNNFDDTRIIGHGGHGTVYKGILSDQSVVAIKKSKIVEKSEIDQFINEVAILSEINHRNIVKLYGCCLETEVPLLVYEFISNGTLSDHLHTTECDSALSWEDRLRIAAEAAGALAYLHSAASLSIFHRDVKSSNILLDHSCTVKVSDFGASRSIPLDQTHIVTAVQGTIGYLDPEYYQTGQLTQKSDVYSFGVILVELLTRQRPTSSMGNEEERNVLMYFLQAIKDQHIFELIEGRAIEEGTREVIEEIIQLTQMCLKLQGSERPTMKEVEFRLQALRKDKPKLEKRATIENEDTKHLLQELYEEIENETSPFTLMSTKDYAPE